MSKTKVKEKYVFISYSSKETNVAIQAKEFLTNSGIKCWMAPDSIQKGEDYSTDIPDAIANCTVFLLILSADAQRSKWVAKELDQAISDNRVIIPFHIDDSMLSDSFGFYLRNIQRLEAYNEVANAYKELINRISAIFVSDGSDAPKPIKRIFTGKDRLAQIFDGIYMALAIAGFLFAGLKFGKWHPGWVAFLIDAALSGITHALLGVKD